MIGSFPHGPQPGPGIEPIRPGLFSVWADALTTEQGQELSLLFLSTFLHSSGLSLPSSRTPEGPELGLPADNTLSFFAVAVACPNVLLALLGLAAPNSSSLRPVGGFQEFSPLKCFIPNASQTPATFHLQSPSCEPQRGFLWVGYGPLSSFVPLSCALLCSFPPPALTSSPPSHPYFPLSPQ